MLATRRTPALMTTTWRQGLPPAPHVHPATWAAVAAGIAIGAALGALLYVVLLLLYLTG